MRGKLIVFEGIDGSGKSTQVALLAERLRRMGKTVVLTAEPTSLPSGKALREALGGRVQKTECEMAAMFVLDRIAHNSGKDGIAALLEQGMTVICDRYYYSTLAYQGLSTDYRWVKSMNLSCPQITRPDLCVYLDLLPQVSLQRITQGREEIEIYENLETLQGVRDRFLEVIRDLREEGEQIVVVNADQSREAVAETIFEAVSPLF